MSRIASEMSVPGQKLTSPRSSGHVCFALKGGHSKIAHCTNYAP